MSSLSVRTIILSFCVAAVIGALPVVAEAQLQDCSTLTSRSEIFNGKTYSKYNILDFSYNQCPQIAATKPAMAWKVKKTEWSVQDETLYSNFIKKLGYSKCNTTDKCLSGDFNILRTEEDMLFTHYSDCADFPYYLRSYFAYKNNLPMALVTSMIQAPFTQQQLDSNAAERLKILNKDGEDAATKFDSRVADTRYSRNGNIPEAKLTIPSSTGRSFDFTVVGPKIMDQISSGTMRMLTTQPGYPETDFYSPKVSKDSIKAGTVLYNVSGHVAVVYDVTEKGEILFIDAHPDNSVSRGSFNPDFQVVRATYGGNFKNFRPIKVLDAVMDQDGVIIKGRIKALSDTEITDLSLEQYEGSGRSATGAPIFKLDANSAQGVDFYDWVKFRLSGGAYRLNPIAEMKSAIGQLCQAAQDRVNAVQAATDNRVFLKDHPANLPQNIFGADGEWESYSSPSRDLRLKLKILSIPEDAKKWLARANAKDPMINYTGTNLKVELIAAYRASVEQCKITYVNSIGKPTTINLETLIGRIANISYDPYQCPETRWGASNQDELATCADGQDKKEWHALQQFLRNNLEKDTAAVQGWSLTDLERMNEHKDVDNNSNIVRYKIGPKLEAM